MLVISCPIATSLEWFVEKISHQNNHELLHVCLAIAMHGVHYKGKGWHMTMMAVCVKFKKVHEQESL